MTTSREKLLAQFRELVTERLQKVARSLVALEAGPDVEAGKLALRELHGLKGEARMMGFSEINSLVHQMEDLIRSGEPLGYAVDGTAVDALLVCSDAVSILAGVTQADAPDLPQLLAWLKRSTEHQRERAKGGAPLASQPAPAAPAGAGSPPAPRPLPPAPSAVPMAAAEAAPPPSSAPPAGSAPAASAPTASAPRPSAPTQHARAVERDHSIKISNRSLEVLTSAATNLLQRGRGREAAAGKGRQLARELVLLHRMAEDLGPLGADLATRLGQIKEFAAELSRTNSLLNTSDVRDLTALAEEIQALRMLPLGVLFEPYPRMVRDLARDLGKEIDLSIEGEDQRVDRSVLDVLRDPVMHLVRNSVDHGIEPRGERVAAGKSPRGSIVLRARREGERLVIAVEDDGRGLDQADLRRVAVRRGFLPEDAAKALSEAAALDLVFLPGFSSKEAATDVSGRGVGLDVVRTNLLQVGGEVTLDTMPKQGSRFELRVPVSLTVAPVLFVQVGDDELCLSAASVVRALQVAKDQPRQIAGRPALAVNDSVIPFASASSILGGAGERGAAEGELVLVLRGRGLEAAVGVDRVLDERVQAILPLKGLLSRYSHLAGATPQPDGRLALVLSAPHLVATANGRATKLGGAARTTKAVKRRRILVVDDSVLTRELLVSLLQAVGYEVLQCQDGAEALDRLGRDTVDLVVTDLEMPRVDGLELTRRLKTHTTLRTLPVVIVTTRGSDEDRRRGMEAGADGYVAKGDLVRQDLVDIVARLLA